MISLKSQTIKAALWSILGTGSTSAVQFGIGIIIARLLSPAEFGLMGMILVFIGLGNVFVEGGFGLALIHNKNATRLEETSVLVWNFGIASAVYAILWFSAPFVAEFYRQPIFVDLLRVLAIRLLVGSFGIVQTSYLTRKLDFKAIARVNILSGFLSGLLAIYLAWKGFGVWALVWQALAATLCSTVFLWLSSNWRPVSGFSWEAIKKMGSYGSKMLVSGLITTVFEYLNNILIGRFHTPADLGYFTRAQNLHTSTVSTLSQSMSAVLLPSLVRVNEDKEAFRRAYMRAMESLLAVTAPIVCCLFVLAEPVIRFLFTDKWLPAVPYFQILCVPALLYPLHMLNLNALLALGKPGLHLKLEIIKRATGFSLAMIALPFGVMALAFALMVGSALCVPINAYYPSKLAGISLYSQVRSIFPVVTGSLVAAVGTWLLLPLLPQSDIARLLYGGAIFSALILPVPILFKSSVYRYLLKNNPLYQKR